MGMHYLIIKVLTTRNSYRLMIFSNQGGAGNKGNINELKGKVMDLISAVLHSA